MTTEVSETLEHTTPIKLPEDLEDADQASLLLFVQGLVNRTAFADDRLNKKDQIFQGAFNATGLASSDPVPIGTVEINTGGYSVVSDEVQVPAAGTYEVTAGGWVKTDNASDPAALTPRITVNGAHKHSVTANRPSTTTTDSAGFSLSVFVQITTPASEKIGLDVLDPGASISANGLIKIRRIS